MILVAIVAVLVAARYSERQRTLIVVDPNGNAVIYKKGCE